MKMNLFVCSLLIGGVCVASVACGSKKSAEVAEQPAEVVKPTVTTAVVNIQDVDMQSVFMGNVEGYAVNNITPQQPRRITRVLVDVGDRVSAGQKVAELDNSSLAQAKAQYENAKASFERSDELYKFGGESKAAWESIKTQYEVAKLTYENLLENTTLANCTSITEVTTINIDSCTCRANYTSTSDMVGSQPIFVVQQISPAKVMINVSENLYSYLKKGMPVSIELDALPEQTFEGKIYRITPSIDAATHTFPVEIIIPNGKEQIKPGMYARVTMKYGTRSNVVVPDRAVVKMLGSGDRFIYVYKADGTVSYQKVELGRRMQDKYEILSGIADGDEVVVTGQAALKDGMAVERAN